MRYIGKGADGVQVVKSSAFDGAVQFPDAGASLDEIKAAVKQVSTLNKRGLHMIKDRESMIAALRSRGCDLFE